MDVQISDDSMTALADGIHSAIPARLVCTPAAGTSMEDAMTKGEARKARKEAAQAGRPWGFEASESGRLEQVQERTPTQEAAHERAMDLWARRNYETGLD